MQGSNRSMVKGLVRLAAMVGVVTLAMAGIAGWQLIRATRPADVPLRIAINPWPGYEFATLAREKGFFAAEGVNVELRELSSLSDARRAFERGQVDGMFATLVEVLVAKEQSGRSSRVALVADWSEGADSIIARAGVASMTDLRGKRVALESDSLNAVVLESALQRHGMSLRDVVPIACSQLKMRAALEAGEVDAVVTYPPISVDISKLEGAHEIFSTRETPGEIIDVLAFEAGVYKKRPDAVARICRAFFRAQEYAQTHPKEALAIMAARQRIMPAEFEAALTSGVRLATRNDQSRFLGESGSLGPTIQRTREAMVGIGMLKHEAAAQDALTVVSDE
ncbi:MAG: ABC transporter substrate-binding protein [Phycisphaerales bacterium]|nr:ABC transporter substrate-binding protein [Phycisphaerales bacterium]